MTPVPQVMDALRVGQERRMNRVHVFARIRSGELDLFDVLADPPEALATASLLDVVRRTSSSARTVESLDALGHAAVRDGVNLLVQLGRSSVRQREWLASRLSQGVSGRVAVRPERTRR